MPESASISFPIHFQSKPLPPMSDSASVRAPEYGRFLEQFRPGQVFNHPRQITFHAGLAQDFAGTFMEACPLFLSRPFAQANGHPDQLVSPLMVLSTALSLGVQNESEKAVAHLGYYDVSFPVPTCVGDTLRSVSRVLEARDRGPGQPGIVRVQTLGINQRNEVAVRYERKILIPSRSDGLGKSPDSFNDSGEEAQVFPWPDTSTTRIPEASFRMPGVTFGGCTFFEDFKPGEIIIHSNGRTVTDEHLAWTYRLGNTHPLHFDALYSQSLPAPMGGAPVVFGAFVFSWIAGLASRDMTENMIWDLGYTEGYHTQPVRSADTLYAITRVLELEPSALPGAGIARLQLIGLKNLHAADALKKYGPELFVRENDKKDLGLKKIQSKVFEIERQVLLRSRST